MRPHPHLSTAVEDKLFPLLLVSNEHVIICEGLEDDSRDGVNEIVMYVYIN